MPKKAQKRQRMSSVEDQSIGVAEDKNKSQQRDRGIHTPVCSERSIDIDKDADGFYRCSSETRTISGEALNIGRKETLSSEVIIPLYILYFEPSGLLHRLSQSLSIVNWQIGFPLFQTYVTNTLNSLYMKYGIASSSLALRGKKQ